MVAPGKCGKVKHFGFGRQYDISAVAEHPPAPPVVVGGHDEDDVPDAVFGLKEGHGPGEVLHGGELALEVEAQPFFVVRAPNVDADKDLGGVAIAVSVAACGLGEEGIDLGHNVRPQSEVVSYLGLDGGETCRVLGIAADPGDSVLRPLEDLLATRNFIQLLDGDGNHSSPGFFPSCPVCWNENYPERTMQGLY